MDGEVCGPNPDVPAAAFFQTTTRIFTMSRKNNATTSQNLTPLGAQLQEFASSRLAPEGLRQQARVFLANKDLASHILGLSAEHQEKFIDKVDQVCRDLLLFFFAEPQTHCFSQAYPTLDSQNAKYIIALGNLCSAILRLPTSAILSEGLKKQGIIAVASGGLTDIWKGGLGRTQVAVKAFRIYPAQNLKEAKEVRI